MEDLSDKVILEIPYKKLLKLFLDVVKLSRSGLTKEEAGVLLKDLSEILDFISKKVSIE